MISCCKSLAAAIFAITLMLASMANVAQARLHPSSLSSTLSSSPQEFVYLHPKRKTSSIARPVVASLRRIPPSTSNPTQNKWPRTKPRIIG